MKRTDVLYRAVRSRGRWARAAAPILAIGVVLTAAPVDGQSVASIASDQQERVARATDSATELLTEWLGPPAAPLSIDHAGIRARWPLLERDRSLERSVIAAVTRAFWATSSPTPFQEALIVYTGTRAIHAVLSGTNLEVVRFFGGVIPYPLRSVVLSPAVPGSRPRAAQFRELPAAGEVARLVAALLTVERYAGWPAVAQALRAIRAGNAVDAAAFITTMSAIRGADLGPLIADLFRTDAVFDYAIGSVTSTPVADGQYESSLSLLRAGSGVFAIGEAGGDPEASLPVLVRFGDASEVREWINGAAPSTTLVYTAPAPVVYAAIDPDLMLLLDVDRANNIYRTVSPARPLGVQLALHWMAWLQQTMLAFGGLV